MWSSALIAFGCLLAVIGGSLGALVFLSEAGNPTGIAEASRHFALACLIVAFIGVCLIVAGGVTAVKVGE